LIDSIIADCGLEKPNAKPRDTPALSTRIVRRDEDGESWLDEKWKYRSLIGKLNFLEKSTRPDIAYSVHQCARFTANPKLSHAEAVKNIVRYLKGTRTMGIILNPKEQALECYADASFGGDWNRSTARTMHQRRNLEPATSSHIAAARSSGPPSYKLRSLFPQPRWNILH
jgi:hypothetical protein